VYVLQNKQVTAQSQEPTDTNSACTYHFDMTGLINYRGFSLSETPKLTGKIAVITGGQAGIGRGRHSSSISYKVGGANRE